MNVQGLSTRRVNKVQSSELINVFSSHDIVLLTETWTNEFSDLNVNGFDHYVLNRTQLLKSSKRASGGIIVYIRNELTSKDTLVFTSEDDILCIKISESKICLQHDLYIFLCYVIPENSSRQAMVERHTLDRVLDYIQNLNSKHGENLNVILCGDMNAHTSDLPDLVSEESIHHKL